MKGQGNERNIMSVIDNERTSNVLLFIMKQNTLLCLKKKKFY